MKHTFKMISLAVLLLLFACQKEKTPVTGTISGNLSSYDPATPLVKTPVAGIKLWLVNADFKFDTVTYSGNRAAIVDSTLSDAQGNYRFSNIPFGKYYVSPLPDTAGYRFEPVAPENADPLQLSEATPDQSLSFSSPWPGGENCGSYFTVEINVINKPDWCYYLWRRQHFAAFIPYFSTNSLYNSNTNTLEYIRYTWTTESKNYSWGYYEIIYGTTNNFLLDFYNGSDQYIESYWITQDLGNTPALSRWYIDMTAHTIRRTYP